jgi:hypothetical protein
MATINLKLTVDLDGIDVTADQLIDLFRDHAPDVLEETVAEALIAKLSSDAPYDMELYGPIIDGLRDLAAEQHIDPELTDIVSVEEG